MRIFLCATQFVSWMSRRSSSIERNAGSARGGLAFLLTLILVLAHSSRVDATWSITVADSKTREVAVGIATCVNNIDLLSLAPVVVVTKGAGTSQSFIDTDGLRRMTIFTGLLNETPPEDILTSLEFLPDHETRQYGIADTQGRTLSFTGSSNFAFANGVTGSSGSLHYAIQGNIITGQPVIDLVELALVITPGDVPEKLMAAMQAARAMGGDGRCSCPAGPEATSCGSPPPSFTNSSINGGMIVARVGDSDDPMCDLNGCADGDYFMRLNVAGQNFPNTDPVIQLQTLFNEFRSNLEGRPDAIQSVVAFGTEGMTIVPQDWRREAITAIIQSLMVQHAPESDGLATIGSAVENPDGTFSVPLTTSAVAGVDRFVVTIDDGIRPVILMPDPTLRYVSIDIKPGSDPNSINPFSAGVIAVAVLGSDTFDVMDVDLTKLVFGPDEAVPAHKKGGHFEDVNDDGFMDLVSHYHTKETGIAMGDIEACLRGEAILPFLGCDSVLTVPH